MKYLGKDIWQLVLYILLAIILVYFVPTTINKILFLGFLIGAWKSRFDYFWLALFFILEGQPGGLFTGGERDDPYRLPIYSLAAGISFTITELYLLLILLKTFANKKFKAQKPYIFFGRELIWLGLLLAALVIVTPLLGAGMDAYRQLAKMLIGLTLCYSIFFIIPNEERMVRFLLLLFPFAFIAVILQVYGLASGQQLIALFKPGVTTTQGILSAGTQIGLLERPIEVSEILFVCFTGSLWIMNTPKLARQTSNIYLLTVNLVSFISMLMTATRSWVIAFTVGYFLFILFSKSGVKKLMFRGLAAWVVILVLYGAMPLIRSQVNNAWQRIATVQQVIEGDITGGGTIIRYDERAPRLMEGFRQSSAVLGAGFSNLHLWYQDYHVGFHNILLNAGILGAILFLSFFYKILARGFLLHDASRTLAVATIAFVMLLTLNIGTQTIGFNVAVLNRYFMQAYTLALLVVAYNYRLKLKYNNHFADTQTVKQ